MQAICVHQQFVLSTTYVCTAQSYHHKPKLKTASANQYSRQTMAFIETIVHVDAVATVIADQAFVCHAMSSAQLTFRRAYLPQAGPSLRAEQLHQCAH